MSVSDSVLKFLEENKGSYVSGGEIASKLNVSRNSVWKAVKALQSKGYEIGAVTNKGYVLSDRNNIISAQSIGKFIDNKNIRVEYCDSVTSTNTVLKERAENGEPEGLLYVASEQTAGKGRRGRSFLSENGTGVYFSLLLRPELKPEDALLITTCAAVSVAEAIEKYSDVSTKIKWVNDIYRDDKKICGILTEAAFDLEGGRLSYAVLGIGINIYFRENQLPEELENIAGSVFDDFVSTDTVSKIVAGTVNNFMKEYSRLTEKKFLSKYRERSYLSGKSIDVIRNDMRFEAQAIDIDDSFRLHVRYPDGKEEYLSTGEVSTKLK